MEGGNLRLERLGGGEVAGGHGVAECAHPGRRHVADNGDDAVTTEGHEGEGGRVVAGEQELVSRLCDEEAVGEEVCGGLFEAEDVGQRRDGEHGGEGEADGGAAGDIVGDDRQR